MKELKLLKKGSLGTHTFLLKRRNPKLGKPSGRDSKYLVDTIGQNWTTALVWIFALSVTWRIFRCGGRTNLTAFGWLIEHSVFGSPVQYVPEEDYAQELEGTWLDERNLRW